MHRRTLDQFRDAAAALWQRFGPARARGARSPACVRQAQRQAAGWLRHTPLRHTPSARRLTVLAAGLAAAGVLAASVIAVVGAGSGVAGQLPNTFAGRVAAGRVTPGLSALADMGSRPGGHGSAGPAVAGDRVAGNLAVGAAPLSTRSQPTASPGGSTAKTTAGAGQAAGRQGRASGQAPASSGGGSQAGRPGAPAGHGRPAAGSGVPRTSCRSVAHIGDSTSVDLISAADLPDPAQRLWDTYARVGVQHLRISASGGRSIVEEMPGQTNGYVVARAWHDEGYRGCWVFALGTNDTANVSAGSATGLMTRIERMMSAAHGAPVLWVNTVTRLSAGPWAESGERRWDDTLARALARYPNMRIFNWAAVAQPGWFLPDGIHYNPVGCADRARAIADALARAFPLHGHGASRVVV